MRSGIILAKPGKKGLKAALIKLSSVHCPFTFSRILKAATPRKFSSSGAIYPGYFFFSGLYFPEAVKGSELQF